MTVVTVSGALYIELCSNWLVEGENKPNNKYILQEVKTLWA